MTAESTTLPTRDMGVPDRPSSWQVDRQVGEVTFGGRTVPLGLLLHYVWEAAPAACELLPLTFGAGRCLYVQMRPYVEVPVRVALRETQPAPRRRVGLPAPSAAGVRRGEIGKAQGWCYPEARTIAVWQCLLFDGCRQPTPARDPTLATVWTMVEQVLLEQLPDARWIVTTDREFTYPEAAWHEFLAGRGYQPLLPRAFVKAVPPT